MFQYPACVMIIHDKTNWRCWETALPICSTSVCSASHPIVSLLQSSLQAGRSRHLAGEAGGDLLTIHFFRSTIISRKSVKSLGLFPLSLHQNSICSSAVTLVSLDGSNCRNRSFITANVGCKKNLRQYISFCTWAEATGQIFKVHWSLQQKKKKKFDFQLDLQL